MGYDFFGYHRKTDDKWLFTTECMYAYQPVFKECFGKDISEFNGRVTKKKVEEFKIGLDKFKSNKAYNRDDRQFVGYLSNITYENLCNKLSELLELMENKEVCYLSIM
jgi:hypothetical protein